MNLDDTLMLLVFRTSTLFILAMLVFLGLLMPLSVGTQMTLPVLKAGGSTHLGTVGKIQIGDNLDELADRLHFAPVEQARDLLERLGVDASLAREAMQTQADTHHIRLEAIPTQASPLVTTGTPYALLFVSAVTRNQGGLYLLSRTKKSLPTPAWRCTDRRTFSGFTHEVSYEFLHVPHMNTPLLLLHHVNVSHGSEGAEDETEGFALRDGRLMQLLHTTDSVTRPQWTTTNEAQTLEQVSSFIPMPDGSLEETRSSTLEGHLSRVERRYWHASAATGSQLQATEFVKAIAR